MALPPDPGPGASGAGAAPATYPAPLDLTTVPENHPFLCRFGAGFEWRSGKLMVLFATPGGPVLWQELGPEQARRLLEWMLASASVGGGG